MAKPRKSASKTGKKAKSPAGPPPKKVELRDLEAREREDVKGGGGHVGFSRSGRKGS
jgi:hypothetical protein